jgi:hypothetical protein
MEIIHRIISLESLISRKSPISLDGRNLTLGDNGCIIVQNSDIVLENPVTIDFNWGKINVENFDVNIFLTQNIDDLGIFRDVDYVDEVPDYTILQNYYEDVLTGLTWTTPLPHDSVFTGSYTFNQKLLYRLRGQEVSDYFFSGNLITGLTNSILNIAKSYSRTSPYQVGLNLNSDPTQYFTGVLSLTTGNTTYVIDALVSDIFNTGIKYDDTIIKRTVYDDTFKIDKIINLTTFSFSGQGWNETNISLSALTKEELDLGIVFPHEINNDVFIDRGINSVLENQIKLSEVKNLGQLERYGNGFFNVKNQY